MTAPVAAVSAPELGPERPALARACVWLASLLLRAASRLGGERLCVLRVRSVPSPVPAWEDEP